LPRAAARARSPKRRGPPRRRSQRLLAEETVGDDQRARRPGFAAGTQSEAGGVALARRAPAHELDAGFARQRSVERGGERRTLE
jgi:hypothetical protein